MNEALRWTLILGCLSLAILEAPRSLPVLVQDLRGPWRAEPIAVAADPIAVADAPAAPFERERPLEAPTNPSWSLKPDGAFASVAPEHVLAADRSPSDRLVRELVSGRFAFLLAR